MNMIDDWIELILKLIRLWSIYIGIFSIVWSLIIVRIEDQ